MRLSVVNNKYKKFVDVLDSCLELGLTSKEKDTLTYVGQFGLQLVREKKMSYSDANVYLFSSAVRKEICKNMPIKYNVFMNVLTTLRKKRLIKDNRLAPLLFPNIGNMVINLEFKDE